MKNHKKIALAGALAAMTMPGLSQANDLDLAKIYVDCGLGGMVGSAFDESQKTLSKFVAISTNLTWDLGTTASTSYFSSEETCMNNKAHLAAFINQSYEKLEKEIANGEGEYFDALASLGKKDTDSMAEYKAQLRAQFASVVADDSYKTLTRYQKVEKLFQLAA